MRDSDRIYDEFLVAAAITGDRPAAQRLVARWHPRLWRHAWRVLGDAERAKDVVQDSWIDIIKGIGRLDDVAAFPAWAFRIVTRRCQRSFGASAWSAATVDDDEVERHLGQPVDDAAESAVDVSLVLAAIGRLPATQRAAMALFYLEDLTVGEIAVATDVPPGTVKTRLLHARRKVRAILDGDDS
jgi:RNA polymerase sigma-70 factor (ECF subfamily)